MNTKSSLNNLVQTVYSLYKYNISGKHHVLNLFLEGIYLVYLTLQMPVM